MASADLPLVLQDVVPALDQCSDRWSDVPSDVRFLKEGLGLWFP